MYKDYEHLSFEKFKNDVEQGLTKPPQFQRVFLWSKEKTEKLFDSVMKDYTERRKICI